MAGRGGRAPEGKMQVIVAVEALNDAPGRLRLGVIEDTSAASPHPFITTNVAPGSTLTTAGAPIPAWPASSTSPR